MFCCLGEERILWAAFGLVPGNASDSAAATPAPRLKWQCKTFADFARRLLANDHWAPMWLKCGLCGTGIRMDMIGQFGQCTTMFSIERHPVPTNIGTTRAIPMATPLVDLVMGVEIWVALRCPKGSFFHCSTKHLLWRYNNPSLNAS